MATAAVDGVAAAGAAEGGKKKGGKLMLVVGLVVLLAAGAAGAWYAGLLPIGTANDAEHAADDEHGAAASHASAKAGDHGKGGGPGTVGSMRPLDPFLANLADEAQSRYLKMTLQVEFVGAEAPPAFDARLPQIRDVILTLVTSKTFADIRTPEGKERLREDVIDRINHVLAQDAVKSVYFTEFIVQ